MFLTPVVKIIQTIVNKKPAVTQQSVTVYSWDEIEAAFENQQLITGYFEYKAQKGYIIRFGDVEYAYTGFSGDTLTGVTPDPSAESGDFYIPLLDVLADATSEASDNIIYSGAPFDIRTRVRKYGFKPYTADTTFGDTGRSFSPILVDDPQAT